MRFFGGAGGALGGIDSIPPGMQTAGVRGNVRGARVQLIVDMEPKIGFHLPLILQFNFRAGRKRHGQVTIKSPGELNTRFHPWIDSKRE